MAARLRPDVTSLPAARHRRGGRARARALPRDTGRRQRLLALAALAAAATAASLILAPPARADELRMEPVRATDGGRTPTRGMTMTKVQAQFGEPAKRVSAVGDPPIARWEYSDFVVYFEYQYVLHTVVKRGR